MKKTYYPKKKTAGGWMSPSLVIFLLFSCFSPTFAQTDCDLTFIEPGVEIKAESCPGASNGAIGVLAKSSRPIQYVLTAVDPPGEQIVQLSPTFEGLAAGVYAVELRDLEIPSCTVAPRTATVPAGEPPAVQITGPTVLCPGASAVLQAGFGFARYQWSDGSTRSSITVTQAGTYSVTVANAQGCTASDSHTIAANPPLVVSAESTPVSGPGAEDGSATATAAGGTPPYDFLWSNGSTQQTINELPPGEYTVAVTDAAGCTVEQTVLVAPAVPMPRAAAIALLLENVLPNNPFPEDLVGFLLFNTGPDSTLAAGTMVTSWDSLIIQPISETTYLFFLDLEPEFEWLHPSAFVFMNAFTGSYTVQQAEAWPLINGEEYPNLTNDSPDRVKGQYATTTTTISYTPKTTTNKDDWAIIVVGRNLTGEAERTARKNDEARIKECLNGAEKGPKIDKDNIISVTGMNHGGATIEEICAAIDGLKGKACRKLYYHYIGHGGTTGTCQKQKDKNRTETFKYKDLACKLLELGVPEVCVTIEACHSGGAIEPLQDKEIEKDGMKVKLKGSVIASSPKDKPTHREPDGAPFVKEMNACCKDPLADLNKDGKISIIEAIAWAKANNDIVRKDNPQGALLGDEEDIEFGTKSGKPFQNSDDGGGTLDYVITKISYKIEDVGVGGRDSIVCRQFLYVTNKKGSPHVGTDSLDIICVKRDRSQMLIKRVKLNLQKNQRLCITDIPEDCKGVLIKRTRKNLPAGLVVGSSFMSVYQRGEPIFKPLAIVDEPDQDYSLTVATTGNWGLYLDPSQFTTHALIDTEWVALRGLMPIDALAGNTVEVTSINHTAGDTSMLSFNALLYDSLTAPLSGPREFYYRFLNNIHPLHLSTGKVELHHSQLAFTRDGSVQLQGSGELVLRYSNIYAEDGYQYTFDSRGVLTMEESGLAAPLGGLRLSGGTVDIHNGAVVDSRSDGVVVNGSFDQFNVQGLYIGASANNALVVEGIAVPVTGGGSAEIEMHDVRIERSGGHDVALRNQARLRLVNGEFNEAKLAVDPGSVLERLWSTQFRLVNVEGQPLAGLTYSISDALGNPVASEATDATGFGQVHLLKEYTYTGPAKTTFGPYQLLIQLADRDTTIQVVINTTDIHQIVLPVMVTSVHDPATEVTGLRLYPNPAGDQLRVVLHTTTAGRGQLQIINALGNIVQSRPFRHAAGEQTIEFDLSSLPAGGYWVRWRENGVQRLAPLRIVR